LWISDWIDIPELSMPPTGSECIRLQCESNRSSSFHNPQFEDSEVLK
jgi:hypothetical protein